MYNHVLLISSDLGLATRLAKNLALPPLGGRLTRLAPEASLPAGPPPLLLLWDDRAAGAPVPAAVGQAHSTAIPVVRLSGAASGERRGEVVDTVPGDAGLSKVIYVVRQRLAAGHLRRARHQQARLAGAPVAPRIQDLSNLLSSLLGNAELALQQTPRLPEESRQRLENVVSLSLAIRDLLAPPAPDSPPGAGLERRAA